MVHEFLCEGSDIWETEFFGVHGDIEEHNGDIADEPAIGAVVEVKKGEGAVCLHQEVVLVSTLMNETIRGAVFRQGVDMLQHGSIRLMAAYVRRGQIELDEVHAGIVPLRAPAGRVWLIVHCQCMHLTQQTSIVLVAGGRPASIPWLLTRCLHKSSDEKLPALVILNGFNQIAVFRRYGPRHRDATARQVVDPIHFCLDECCALAKGVPNAEDVAQAIPFKFIDEALEGIQRFDLMLCNTIALHGLLKY